MTELSEAARNYFADLNEPYRRLQEWARDDDVAGRRLLRLVIVEAVVVLGFLLWLLASSVTPSTGAAATCEWLDPFCLESAGSTVAPHELLGAALTLVGLVFGAWIAFKVHKRVERWIRPALPASLTAEQISFMATAQLAQALNSYIQTGLEFHLSDAKLHAVIGLGPDVSRYEYLSFDDYDPPEGLPRQSHGILIGDEGRRLRQARIASRALNRQEWIAFPQTARANLVIFGSLPRSVWYCLESEQALDQVATVSVALAEVRYLSIARDLKKARGEVNPDRAEVHAASAALVKAAMALPGPPRPVSPTRVDRSPLRIRVLTLLRRPRLLWSFIGWTVPVLVVTSLVSVLADAAVGLELDGQTMATIIIPTTILGAAALTAVRTQRGAERGTQVGAETADDPRP